MHLEQKATSPQTLRTFIPTVSLLRECRTRLVADVVTGKLDLRTVEARLPAEPEAEVEALKLEEGLDLPRAAKEEGSYEEPESNSSE